MKILHVIPSVSEKSGGPSHAILPMCRSLRERGVEVLLATTDADLEQKSVSLDRVQDYRGLSAIFFKKQWGGSFKYSQSLARWLAANVSSFDLVHIHAVFNHSSMAAADACRRHRVPYVVRPLGTLDPWGMGQKSWRKKVFLQAYARKMLSSAAAIHYTSRGEKSATEGFLGMNGGVVIPLGVDTPDLHEASLDETSVEIPNLGQHPYVLVLSRLLPTKGISELVDAFLALVAQPQFADWRLVLAGDGPEEYLRSLRDAIAHSDARPGDARQAVIFAGWLEGGRKEAALRGASLLALTSRYESFGLCVMEALACSVPVLISPHVNLAPDVEAAGAGWIAPLNPNAIGAALAEAMTNNDERSRRGEAGRKLAQNFTWANVSAQLTDLYQSLI